MSTNESLPRSPLWPRIFGVVLALIGLALLIGGIRLVTLGGSWYYMIAGAATVVSGVMLARAQSNGAKLFLLAVIGTMLWTIYEAGSRFWGWVPRMAPMLVLGLIAALALRSLNPSAKKLALPAALVQVLVLIAGAIGVFTPHSVAENTAKLATETVRDVPVVTDAKDPANNSTYFGHDAKNSRFAPIDEINASNVNKLEVAWQYRTGAESAFPNEDVGVPLHVDNMVYLCTPANKVIALDATTGEEKWNFDPVEKQTKHWNRCRGVAYYEVPADKQSSDGKCNGRIILSDKLSRLWAMDAKTGELCEGFGDTGKGYTDLSVGMGIDPDPKKEWYYMPTSQPMVADGKAIIGGWVWDGKETNEPSGVIRSYNLMDGSLEWAWDLGNPEITKLPPEGQTYTKGTPNYWSHGSYDEKLGLVYLPLGNATPDFWVKHRTEAMNKYATTLVALDAKTGREAWHFQTVHLDTWDYDNATPPTLFDMEDGTPALVMGTKTHQLFVLDRRTGKPLKEVQELPVPQVAVEGDVPPTPTQPFSTEMPQLSRGMNLQEKDMWGTTMFDQLYCRIKFKQLNYQGAYTKVTREPTLVYPGYYGGYNWGGHAIDPRTNMLIVNDMDIPQISFLEPQDTAEQKVKDLKAADITNAGWKNSHVNKGTPYQTIRATFNSFLGVPCNEPSWGNLIGIDLKTGQVAWKRPMGTVEDTEFMGIKTHMPVPLGLPTLSGPLATAGGLTFYTGTQDYYLRAFETATGKEVWKFRLPVGSQATPVTYKSPDGRQYLLVTAGGARQSKDRGDYVMAFALPKQ